MNASNQQEGADSPASDPAVHDAPPAAADTDGRGGDEGTQQQETPAQVPSHTENIRKALELLYEHFPKAFMRNGEVRPLKIGVFYDLRERIKDIDGLSVSKVRDALRIYTSRLAYQRALQQDGARRIDLDGNECGEVDSGHVAFARERSEAIRAARREKLKAARASDSDTGAVTQQPAGPESQAPAGEAAAATTAADSGASRNVGRGQAATGKAGPGGSRGPGKKRDTGKGPYARPRVKIRDRGLEGGEGGGAAEHRGSFGMRCAGQDDLRAGAAVLVQSSHGDASSHASYVHGVISRAEKGGVMVTLRSGMTVSVPPERLRIEITGGQSKD